VRSYTRHQLKENAFATQTAETISWARENRSFVTTASVVVVAILAIIAGVWAFLNYRDQQAKTQLSLALQKFGNPIRPAGTPALPDAPSYGSIAERAKATNGDFTQIADKYSHTQSSAVARYFAGITARDMGNNSAAEKDLQEVADSRYPEIASLSKMALASIYHDAGKNSQAVDLYKQLIAKPTVSVGKNTAQFALAGLYQATARPDEAKHLYEQMQKESPGTVVAQLAGQRLQEMTKQ
jgi:tetratricopeptide (TPR) repeat protein